MSGDTAWTVESQDDTVVVTFPEGCELDQSTGEEVNREFMGQIKDTKIEKILTELYIDNPIDSGVFSELEKAADAAVENGISKWAVVVNARVKGMAFRSQLEGLDARVFESKSSALDFLQE